ncbi:hypothetical protein AYI69_g10532 [Smittium culicis]|uniref:Uncharacterized protein n=1 Tax=Smittium culicis TaxID=133412 RepID=A0A1R1X596_9FUNG|nr:hypothetical protein AYI69_g10532 [Smittium culicis]
MIQSNINVKEESVKIESIKIENSSQEQIIKDEISSLVKEISSLYLYNIKDKGNVIDFKKYIKLTRLESYKGISELSDKIANFNQDKNVLCSATTRKNKGCRNYRCYGDKCRVHMDDKDEPAFHLKKILAKPHIVVVN